MSSLRCWREARHARSKHSRLPHGRDISVPYAHRSVPGYVTPHRPKPVVNYPRGYEERDCCHFSILARTPFSFSPHPSSSHERSIRDSTSLRKGEAFFATRASWAALDFLWDSYLRVPRTLATIIIYASVNFLKRSKFISRQRRFFLPFSKSKAWWNSLIHM